MTNHPIPTLLALLSSLLVGVSAPADETPLAENFDSPPATAKPSTWWHWMRGNVTKEGITLDLEWMKRVGLSGASVFEIGPGLSGKAVQRSEYWQEMIRHAIGECARLGLEIGLHNSSGWNNSAGPWVEPADSMKKPVFSRALITGPAKNPVAPPPPPGERIFPFTDLNYMNSTLKNDGHERTDYEPYYEDVALFAYPAPEGALPPMRELNPILEPAAAGRAESLWDDDHTTGIDLGKALTADGKDAEIFLKFPHPITARSLSLVSGVGGLMSKELELSVQDGTGAFQTVKTFSMFRNNGVTREFQSVSFDPVSAQVFRLKFIGITSADRLSLRELELSGEARIEAWPIKAGFQRGGWSQSPDVVADPSQAVPLNGVLNLTDKLRPDGTLEWEAPPGNWILLRMGATSTGKMNHPSSIGGLGLEVDKFDLEALDQFFKNGIMQMVIDLAGEHAGRTLKIFDIDSWEVGAQNWTGDMAAQFQKRRGYDPLPYLPALSGQIVESADITERFLRDWRQTCSNLFAEHFYASFQRFCHRHGMGLFIQPGGNANNSMLEMGGFIDHVSTEFWTRDGWFDNPHSAKPLHSMVNTYGTGRLEAEAFTSQGQKGNWRQHPRLMKSLGDRAFAHGINHFVFHTSAHQPWVNTVPGMTMGGHGINYTRNNTWAEQSVAWIEYLTRCQAMLQAGRYAADVLIFVGEDAPVKFKSADAAPEGYGFDACDATILREHATIENGEIVLESGMRYRLLVLADSDIMSISMASVIRDLIRDGATVLFRQRPIRTPGLENYPESEQQLESVITELFGDLDGNLVTGRAYGKGRVLFGTELEPTLKRLGIEPAWTLPEESPSTALRVTHRITGTDEFFFLASNRPQAYRQEVSFRIENGAPEIWHPYHGTRQRMGNVRHENRRTLVTLDFEPDDAFFVVFPEKPTTDKERVLPALEPLTIQSAWYGHPDDESKRVDITEKLRGQIANNTLNVMMNNLLVGGDPAPGVRKVAEVAYSIGGSAPQTTRVPENSPLVLSAPPAEPPVLQSLSGPWTVAFQENRGAPAEVTLAELIDLSTHSEEGIKYFSGTSTYSTRFNLQSEIINRQSAMLLDLGQVEVIAEVKLNGQDLGIFWKYPYQVDITDALRVGENELEVRVTNLWPNRLIGDERQFPVDNARYWNISGKWADWVADPNLPDPTGRIAFHAFPYWKATDDLFPSGLIGPVRLMQNPAP